MAAASSKARCYQRWKRLNLPPQAFVAIPVFLVAASDARSVAVITPFEIRITILPATVFAEDRNRWIGYCIALSQALGVAADARLSYVYWTENSGNCHGRR